MGIFTHLRTHSSYSLKDGLLSEDQIIDLAVKNNQPSVAITDLGKMFTSVSFYEKARAKGIKPIVGVDAYIETDITNSQERSEPTRLLLLAKDENGYKNLMALVSRAHTENLKKEIPYIKQSWFGEATKGIIALSGDSLSGDIALDCITETEVPYKDRVRAAKSKVEQYKSFFPDGFFLEVQRAERSTDDMFVRSMVSLSLQTNVPLVATHPVQFEKRSDFYYHEIRTCLNQNQYVSDIKRNSQFTRDQYFKSTEEMEELFKDIPQAINNANMVAKLCSITIDVGNPMLPKFPTPNNEREEDYLTNKAKAGLEEKLKKIFSDEAERLEKRKEYDDRLNYELSVINKMGFSGYFLIVADFIEFAKSNDIAVGPGRGSGAGSLAALALDIIEVDPIKYDLLFERFLNPERVSMPDFDIDFDTERKTEVMEYVRKKYDSLEGDKVVSLISAFNMSRPKSAVKDTGKILQTYNKTIYRLSDYVNGYEFKYGKEDYSLQDVFDNTPELRAEYENDNDFKKLFDAASRMVNIPKSLSKHPGGLVISKGNLTNYSPLLTSSENGKAVVVSQFDKDQVERAGLVKFDFLSVRNLDIIYATEKLINKRPEFRDAENKFSVKDLTLDDKSVYHNFAQGNTIGVFQFEGAGMRKTLKTIKANNFNDLVASVALFRPGPMAYIPDYAKNKENGKYNCIVPEMDEILKDTHGIMIYQEQVMQVAQKLGGYTLGKADNLRKAMGKKMPQEMAKHRSTFTEGCVKNGISNEKANEVFDSMEKFAEYGFNKSHSVAYAIISYRTAYLKTYYPEEYFSCLMNVEKSKINTYIQDLAKNDIEILAPDINKSQAMFSPDGRKKIRFGLTGVKDVSSDSVKELLRVREEKGEFTSFFDFFKKIDRSKLSEKVITQLIKAGAFDSIDPRRDVLIENIDSAMKYAGKLAREKKEKGYILHELFGAKGIHKDAKKLLVSNDNEVIEPEMVAPQKTWSEIDYINEEKNALGLCLSRNLFNIYQKKLGGLEAAVALGDVDTKPVFQTFLFAGIVTKKDEKVTNKDSKPIAFITLDDGFTSKDIVMYDSVYKANIDKFVVGEFVAIEGQVKSPRKNSDETSNGISVNQAFTFDDIREKLISSVHLALKQDRVEGLIEILRKHKGEAAVKIYLPNNENKYTFATLNEEFNINAGPECMKELENYLGESKVKPSFKKEITFPKQAFANQPYKKPFDNKFKKKPKKEEKETYQRPKP